VEHLLKNMYLHKFQALQPLMQLAAQHDAKDILAWVGAREVLRDLRDMLVEQYAWAVPNTQALYAIADYGPLVEVGAGTGYWAYLLRLMGVDIVAYDLKPRADGETSLADGEPVSFTEVLPGTEEDAVRAHPQRTLLLCWPPADDPMALRALRLTAAEHVIYIGWKDDAVTGCPDFHRRLRERWELLRTVEIPQWPEMCDRLFIYRRR
jgi:hypothetical protein